MRVQRLSKERMEDVGYPASSLVPLAGDAGDGYVYDNSGRKLRKPRLSSEEIPEHEQSALPTDDSAPKASGMLQDSFMLGTFLVAAVVTMVAFKSDWSKQLNLEPHVPSEYAAPAMGFVAAVLVHQTTAFAQRMLTVD